jgi:DNA invertase Pin-like site-specific DNA recombinase
VAERALIIARAIGTNLQAREILRDQVRAASQYCRRRGYEVAGVVEVTDKYQAATALIEALKRGDFDVVVTRDPTRLSKNPSEQANILAWLRSRGIRVEFVVSPSAADGPDRPPVQP